MPRDPAQGENTRRLMTLLWFLINLAMIGFLFTSFFVGGRVPLGLCIAPNDPPTPAPTADNITTDTPTSTSPTASPVSLANGSTLAPSVLPSKVPTSSPTNSTDDDEPYYYDDGNAGFVMMWSTFLLVSLSVGGTTVLKSCRTPFAVGGFAGVVLVMANLMFLMAATSAGELRRRARLGVSTSADEAILAFCVIEFLLLSAFAIVLIRHKDEVLEAKPGVDEMMDPRSFETSVQGARGI
jgi:hypothetical protein